jgi:hypothetical protein
VKGIHPRKTRKVLDEDREAQAGSPPSSMKQPGTGHSWAEGTPKELRDSRTISDNVIMNHRRKLKDRLLLVIKDSPVSFLPNMPSEHEKISQFFLSLILFVLKKKEPEPLEGPLQVAKVLILWQGKGISKFSPAGLRVITIRQQMRCGFILTETESTGGITLPVFLLHVISRKCFIMHDQPSEESTFWLSLSLPNFSCREGYHCSSELACIG